MIQSVAVNGIEISYEVIGDGAETLVLIAGGGNQMLDWSDSICQLFVEQNYRVVRFDNRDVGTSSKIENDKDQPYALDDMADDVAGLIRHISSDPVHVLGGSLGGMIAQRLAIRHTDLVATMCLCVTTTGNAALFKPSASLDALMAPIPENIDEYIDQRVELDQILAGTAFEFDEASKRRTRIEALERCDDRAGQARHGQAFSLSLEDSAYQKHCQHLRELELPVSIIQAGADELFDIDHGEELFSLIPNATYKVIEGLDHEMPPGVWPVLVGAIVGLKNRSSENQLSGRP